VPLAAGRRSAALLPFPPRPGAPASAASDFPEIQEQAQFLRRNNVSKEVISTPQAPAAIGPYSQAIRAGGLVYLSGQIPIDAATGRLEEGDISAQTERVLENLAAVLEAAGSGLSRVLKTTVYLKDLEDFGRMNEVYGRYFGEKPPARATVQVARLPRDARVEIDLVAEA
jgi:2-iminobutanoate/2-iminopropanoate deaminase